MTPAQIFFAIVQESRRRQFEHDRDAVRALEALLTQTAAELRRKLIAVPTGLRKERYRRDLLASVETTLDTFREQYRSQLDNGILESARIAVQREADTVETLVQNREGLTFEQLSAAIIERGAPIVAPGVQFGVVPQEVLERLYARTFQDGLNLSQRLYNLDKAARTELQEIVAKGIATGQSARDMAKALTPTLEQSGVDNVRYKAMRIARTEINQAYREGHIVSATDQAGNLHPWISAIGWRLSPAHPRTDICDIWASDDSDGLGDGNYESSNVPPGHPNCMCFTVSILASMPDEQFVAMHPDPEGVPNGQLKYYGFDVEED